MKKKAFTLIELITVIVIIGIVTSVALPVLNKATLQAKDTEARKTISTVVNSQRMYFLEYNTYIAADYTQDEQWALLGENPNKEEGAKFQYRTYFGTYAGTKWFSIIAMPIDQSCGYYFLYESYPDHKTRKMQIGTGKEL